MSKAFTKENDSDDSDDAVLDPSLRVPIGKKNYITPAGAGRLKAELKRLLHEERPEVVRVVSWAASNGDRSENADYTYGKRRLREIDRRIRFLTKRLDAAEIIDPIKQHSERILFGATVVVDDEEGRRSTYRIVGIDETDVKRGHISWISPIGNALLQAKQGDAVTLRTPKGDQELEIVEIRYEKIGED